MGIAEDIQRYLDYQRDWTENELYNRVYHEQKQADIEEYRAMKVEEQEELRRQSLTQRQLEEQADLKLASELRELADRIERRYK